MIDPRSATGGLMIVGQGVLIAVAVLIGLAPPAEGVMLVIPVAPATAGATMRWVGDAGGRLVAPASLDGALFVFGQRAPIVRAALSHGALILRAPGAGCTPKEVS